MALTLEDVRDWIHTHFPTETGRKLFLEALGVVGTATATTRRRARGAVRAARATAARNAPRPGTLPARLLAFGKGKVQFTNAEAMKAVRFTSKQASQLGTALVSLKKRGFLVNVRRGVWKVK
jgi:hypothetical protein